MTGLGIYSEERVRIRPRWHGRHLNIPRKYLAISSFQEATSASPSTTEKQG